MNQIFLILILFLSLSLASAQETTTLPEDPAIAELTQDIEQKRIVADNSVAASGEAAPVETVPVIASAVSVEDPHTQAWLEQNADQPYIALLNEYTTTIKPDWSYEEVYHSRVKIQKEVGKELGQWPIYYNKARDTIADTDIMAHVETPDGHRYPATNIQDMAVYNDSPMYSDMRMKVVTLPQVNIGSVIDVTVKSTTTRKEIPGQFWAEILYPAIPTQHAKHVFIFPEDKPIKFKTYKMDYKPTVEKIDGQIKYTVSFDETNPIPGEEELMPPLQEMLGGIYLSSMDDWKTVADWYRALIVKNTVESAEITAKTLELTKDKTTEKDKIQTILEFIQDNFRYVSLNFGDNSVEPHPTNEVFKNLYGDCKDLSLLVKQMLKIAGIDSRIVLFSEEYTGNPQAGLPNPNVFTHVILQITLDGKDYYVDPQLKGFDIGELPSNYDNAHVLVIDDTGFKFDNLPVAPAEDRALITNADVTINLDGSADFRVHVKFPLEASQSFKRTWNSASNEEKDKFFENLEQGFAKNGKMLDRKVSGLENRYEAVEFDLRYHSPNAYPVINDMILIKEENQFDVPNFAQERRKYPIFVSSNSLMKTVNTYHVPEGFNVNFVPPSYSLSVDMMDVQANYQSTENTVEIASAYHIKRANVPIERYGQVKDFRKDLFKKNDRYIILKKSSDVSPQAKERINI